MDPIRSSSAGETGWLKLAWLRTLLARGRGGEADAESLYRALAENANELLSVLDENGRILYSSPEWQQRLGYAPDELEGASAVELLALEDAEGNRPGFEQVRADTAPGPRLFRVRHRDGSHRWIEMSGTRFPVAGGERVIGFGHDVTERRRLQAGLEGRERHYRELVEAAPDLILKLDAQGRALYANPAFTETLGYSAAELRGGSVLDLIHPEERRQAAVLLRALSREERSERLEVRVRRSDGSWCVLETALLGYRQPRGRRRIAVIAHDVTERVRVEAELRARLAEAQRLSAPENLAGSVAHSINNPLAALKGVVEMALEARDGNDPTLDRVLYLARRIEKVVYGTLGFFRRGQLDPELLETEELLDRVHDELRERASAQGVKVTLSLHLGAARVRADAALIISALVSIAGNALEAMPDGGELWLEALPAKSGHSVVLGVSDSGPGIAADLREKVLEPFFTTKGGGAGLGLAIANHIVEAHGGSIRIAERFGGGAAVSVELPVGGASV